MNVLKIKILVLLLLAANYLSAFPGSKKYQPEQDKSLFVNLFHQHHDFFGKAFSLQGIELGTYLNQNLVVGCYGSCFASNLQAVIAQTNRYSWMGQYGLLGGYLFSPDRKLHTGMQISAGLFSLRTDEKNFGLFERAVGSQRVNGFVYSPQLFGELCLNKWLTIRTGFSYNLYQYHDKTLVQPSDLNHLSFTFGLLFKVLTIHSKDRTQKL